MKEKQSTFGCKVIKLECMLERMSMKRRTATINGVSARMQEVSRALP